MTNKCYKFHVDIEKEKDIFERLESIPRPLRGEFIKSALKFYMSHYNYGNYGNHNTQDSPIFSSDDVF